MTIAYGRGTRGGAPRRRGALRLGLLAALAGGSAAGGGAGGAALAQGAQPGAAGSGAAGVGAADRVRMLNALSKIEANVAEASANLYLHALLPASNSHRAEVAKDLADDQQAVDGYVRELEGMASLPAATREALAKFKADWARVRELAAPLARASRDSLPAPDALVAHWTAVEELDEAIDSAIEAVANT